MIEFTEDAIYHFFTALGLVSAIITSISLLSGNLAIIDEKALASHAAKGLQSIIEKIAGAW